MLRHVVGLVAFAVVAVGSAGDPDRAMASADAQPPQPPSGTLTVDLFHTPSRVHLLTTERSAGSVVLVHHQSADGGVAWSPATAIEPSRNRVANPSRNNDPQVVAVGDDVTVVWTSDETVGGVKGHVESARSMDGGRTWERGGRVNDRGFTEGWGYIDVTASTEGRLTAVWIGVRKGAAADERGLQFASSDDRGRTWQPNGFVDTEICECCWNIVTTGWSDALLTLFRDIPRDMALARSADGGRTWSRRATVGAFGWTINGCPDVGGGVVKGAAAGELYAMVWTGHEETHGLYVVRSRDNGDTWDAPIRVGHDLAKHGDIAFDGRRIVVAWDASVGGQVHVGWTASTDGGRTWQDAVRLSPAGVRATHPRLAATTDGVVVVWTETAATAGRVQWRSAVLR